MLLKSPQNKAASTIAITEKSKRTIQAYHYIPAAFRDKIIDFTDEPERTFIR